MRIKIDIPACNLDIEWEPETGTLFVEDIGYSRHFFQFLRDLDGKMEIEKNSEGDLLLRKL